MDTDVPVSAIAAELRQLVDLGVLEYYLPTTPEGEEYVVGMCGQIVKLTPETVLIFLAGVSATAHWAAERHVPSFSLRDAFGQ